MAAGTITIKPNTEEVDAWIADFRLLLSQIGFAIDNYLAARLTTDLGETSES